LLLPPLLLLLLLLLFANFPGNKRRPALLRDLWRAQQPPGRLSRAIPRLQRLLGRTLMVAGLIAVGFVLGHNAQQQWGSGGRRFVQEQGPSPRSALM
jgi:hypothetical protein